MNDCYKDYLLRIIRNASKLLAMDDEIVSKHSDKLEAIAVDLERISDSTEGR